MTAAADDLSLQVTPQNVLAVRNVILGEAERLDLAIQRYQDALRVPDLGHDPVSPYASRGFNRKIEDLVRQMRAYIGELRATGESLRATATAYGHTEAEITQSFRDHVNARLPQWDSQLRDRDSAARLPQVFRPLVEPELGSRSTPTVPGLFGERA